MPTRLKMSQPYSVIYNRDSKRSKYASPDKPEQSVQEQIEENKRTLDSKLHLYNHDNLDEIPDELFELVHLKELGLHGFELATVPVKIYQLTSLTELYLHDTRLAKFPIELRRLSNLRHLSVYSLEIQKIPLEVAKWTTLTYLNISSCRNLLSIEALPPNLTYIYLGDSFLQSIPSAVFSLKKLLKLVVSGLRLESLPPDIANL